MGLGCGHIFAEFLLIVCPIVAECLPIFCRKPRRGKMRKKSKEKSMFASISGPFSCSRRPKFYRFFAEFLPNACRIFTEMLPMCCHFFAEILPKFCRFFAEFLPNVCRMLAECLLNACRMVAEILPIFCRIFADFLPDPSQAPNQKFKTPGRDKSILFALSKDGPQNMDELPVQPMGHQGCNILRWP